MKRLSLIVFISLACLMTSSVFASYNWMQADPNWAPTDNWLEPNQWDVTARTPPSQSPGVPPLGTTTEIKMITNSGTGGTAHCTVNSNVGSYTGATVSVSGNLYINSSSAVIGFNRTGSGNGLRVGSTTAGGTGPTGTVYQSAGTVTATNIYLGYGGAAGAGTGIYDINGGSLTCSTSLTVGGGRNTSGTQQTVGTFTVEGASSTISVTALRVGGYDVTTTTNSGTLEFKLGSGVSAIGCTSVNLDAGGANSETDLLVSLTSATPPPAVILLVDNTGTAAVTGTFDKLNGGSAAEGASVSLTYGSNTYNYTLTYQYNADGDGRTNDIALIPEPATIALFGLGLLALVRRPRRK